MNKRPCISSKDRLYSLSFFFISPLYRAALLALLLTLLSASRPGYSAHYHDDVDAFPPWKEGRELGELNMPVSSDNEQARLHFQTGVKLVHLYEFPEPERLVVYTKRHETRVVVYVL